MSAKSAAAPRNMRVAGIDADTKQITTAVYSEYGDQLGLWRVEYKGRRAEDRFFGLMSGFARYSSLLKDVDFVWVEQVMFVHNYKALRDQALVLGGIRALLNASGIPSGFVDPGTWKKATVGSGHASKEEIKQWAQARFPRDLGTQLQQDYYDAACIAAFGALTMGAGQGRST